MLRTLYEYMNIYQWLRRLFHGLQLVIFCNRIVGYNLCMELMFIMFTVPPIVSNLVYFALTGYPCVIGVYIVKNFEIINHTIVQDN